MKFKRKKKPEELTKKTTKSKKTVKKTKSPKINRTITDKQKIVAALPSIPVQKVYQLRSWKQLMPYILTAVVSIVLLIEILGVIPLYYKLQATEKERDKVGTELTTWEKNTLAQPGYRDGYLHMAVLAYQLGNTDKANRYLSQALLLDPNYQPALRLKGILITEQK